MLSLVDRLSGRDGLGRDAAVGDRAPAVGYLPTEVARVPVFVTGVGQRPVEEDVHRAGLAHVAGVQRWAAGDQLDGSRHDRISLVAAGCGRRDRSHRMAAGRPQVITRGPGPARQIFMAATIAAAMVANNTVMTPMTEMRSDRNSPGRSSMRRSRCSKRPSIASNLRSIASNLRSIASNRPSIASKRRSIPA